MNRKLVFIIMVAGAVGFIVLLASIFLQLSSLRTQQRRDGEKLFRELESISGRQREYEEAMRSLGRENNQLRRAMNLPERDFDFSFDREPAAASEDDDPDRELEQQFYLAVDTLLSREKELQRSSQLSQLLKAGETVAFMRREGLAVEEQRGGRAQFFLAAGDSSASRGGASPAAGAGAPLASLELGEDGYRLAGSGGAELVQGTLETSGEGLPRAVMEELGGLAGERRRQLERFREDAQMLARLHGDAEAAALRRERELRFSSLQQDDRRAAFTVTTGDGLELFSVLASFGEGGVSVNGQSFHSTEEARDAFLQLLRECDSRTEAQRAVDEAQETIASLAADEAFSAYLQSRELSLSLDMREDGNYYYYDLLTPQEARAGALGVHKLSGELYLFDRDSLVIGSLKSLGFSPSSPGSSRSSSFELPSDDILASMGRIDGGGKTILLCGSHENNADSIMIAHITPERADLIAMPRDLWWKNRKLNNYFNIYGPDRFKEIVGELTGLSIDNYIVVDMWAFIDVINILGGVEVTLEEALIDPSYRIRENGEWKTLHYRAGTHHLDGIAALRVARSRHTSDDFDRARRQQLVIAGIKERFDQLGAGELTTFYQLIQSLTAYVDTDFSPFELARLYLENRNIAIRTGGGLNTDNILVATYSNLLGTDKSEEDLDDDFYKGLWILVPRENNWKLIPWYIRQLTEGSA